MLGVCGNPLQVRSKILRIIMCLVMHFVQMVNCQLKDVNLLANVFTPGGNTAAILFYG